MPDLVYRFGPYEINPSEHELRKRGVRLQLPPQPFRLLVLLIENQGRLMSRETLCKVLWPEGTYVDAERGLNTAIKKIRDVLNDSADTPRFIETIPKTGYRFIAPVERVGGTEPLDHGGGNIPARPPSDHSIAVLDFTNINADPAFEWLAAGIAETLTGYLKRVPALQVSDRPRVIAALRHNPGSQARAALGVRWMLEGKFKAEPERLRISAVLSGTTDRFDFTAEGSLTDVFQLIEEISSAVLRTLRVEAAQAAPPPETSKFEAYQYLAKGRCLFNQFDPTSFVQAEAMFRKAIEIDPDYALAWSGVASVYVFRFIRTTDPADLENGVEMLKRAIGLDAELAYPWVWLTYAYFRQQKFALAIETGLRAVELEPRNYQAHYFLSTAYIGQFSTERRLEQAPPAIAALRECVALEPNYQPAHMILAWIHMVQGESASAEPHIRKVLEIEESGRFEATNFIGAYTLAGNFHFRLGRIDESETAHRRSLQMMQSRQHMYKEQFTVWSYCGLADILMVRRHPDQALENLHKARARVEAHPRGLGMGYCVIRTRAGLARVFHKLGMSRESSEQFDGALELIRSKDAYDFSWFWEGGDAQAWYDLARAAAVLSRGSEALEHLRSAIECGWRDRDMFLNDECMDSIRQAMIRVYPWLYNTAQ